MKIYFEHTVINYIGVTQPAVTCSKLKVETLE